MSEVGAPDQASSGPRTPTAPRASSEPGTSPTLRDWAHLYEAADELTARCLAGDAARVLDEVGGRLVEAEAARVADVLHRLRYVVALADLNVGELDLAIEAADLLIVQASDSGDPGWPASAHAIRGIARSERGDRLAAVDDLVDATVLLDDARPTGQPFAYAVDAIGVGYLRLRLYELALEVYERGALLVGRPGMALPRMLHLLHRMLVEVRWGLDLERLGRAADARSHFDAARSIAAETDPLPVQGARTWSLRVRALVGLCQALSGDADAAEPDLAAALPDLGEPGLPEEPLARIGLARALGDLGQRDEALAEIARAELSAIGDHDLELSVAWERRRLIRPAVVTAAESVVDEYAARLEEERWADRLRFAEETRDRLETELRRRAARKMSAEYLTDSLTGVANRRHLELRLPEMVVRAQTRDEAVALAFVDLDADVAADELVRVATTLRTRAGAEAFVARYGGNELVVVMPALTARQLADVVDGVIGARSEHQVRPKVGVASATRPPSVAGLVAAADEALLAARRAGGGIRLAVG